MRRGGGLGLILLAFWAGSKLVEIIKKKTAQLNG